MQAIILAAGMGKRFGKPCSRQPKCMVKVNGVRIIDRMLGQLLAYSLDRIVIVIGYMGDVLRQYIHDHYPSAPIEFIENELFETTNNIYSLWLAGKYLGEDDTLLIESDIVVGNEALQILMNAQSDDCALIGKYHPWMNGTMVTLDSDSRITSFIPSTEFSVHRADSYFKTVNIYRFSKAFIRSRLLPGLRNSVSLSRFNDYYEEVLRTITLADGPVLTAIDLKNIIWYEIDNSNDLRIAEALFADPEKKLQLLQSSFGGYWRYPALLDFCYLVNPFFPTPRLIDQISLSLNHLLQNYPSGMNENSALASEMMNLKVDHVVVGNGASEIIRDLMSDLSGPVGIIYPTFEEYSNRLAPKQIIGFNPWRPDFAYTAADLMDYFDNNPIEALILVNPDNPSGNFLSRSELEKFAAWSEKRSIRLIIDESFIDFSDSGARSTLMVDSILEKFPTLCVIKSISKCYGIPGLRLGILASADSTLISRLRNAAEIWNINSLAELFMQIIENHRSDYEHSLVRLRQERATFFEELSAVPYLHVIPSQANYFLCEIVNRFSSHDVCCRLLSHSNILIKDCSQKKGFPDGRQFIRIAIRSRSENHALIKALRF